MVVEPPTVDPGQSFSVRSAAPIPLPAKINCTVSSTTTGEKIQWNVLDVSGEVTLNLKEKFGALQLEACDEEICVETACFEYTFSNVGSGDMTVTMANRSINGGPPANLVDQVVPNPLSSGQSATVEEKVPGTYGS